MSELGRHLESLTDELPPTSVAHGAWEQGRRRVRRRRVGATGLGAAATVTVVLVASLLSPGDGAPRPMPAVTPSETGQSPDGRSSEDPGRGESEPGRVDSSRTSWPTPEPTGAVDIGLPATLELGDPFSAEATPLSEDPVDHGVLAIEVGSGGTVVVVLGDDGRWRVVDVALATVSDGGGNWRRPLHAGSLSADGTRLAIVQPQGLVVVDLTTGSSRSYEVPGVMVYVAWQDKDHVLVVDQDASGELPGRLVSLGDGSVRSVPYGAGTTFLPDGGALEWPRTPGPSTWTEYAGTEELRQVYTPANNGAGLYPDQPLVNADLVVGHVADHRIGARPVGNAVVVVDRASGNQVALLPTDTGKGGYTQLLGWVDDQILLGLPDGDRLRLVLWDHTRDRLRLAGELDRLGPVSVTVDRLGER
ncbi:hypothetical protein [Nocardioides sp.]|uniref:hypothetical protein n=1 Tax=Nocardioides sp. TaxID=35761 RepID=UPI002734EBB3|nr:hypothetical protein [Nocardioides sp.]MDP3890802.1 hypothetical protein [Nocardioides sp.]